MSLPDSIPSSPAPPEPQPTLADLQQSIASLRVLFQIAVAALILVCASTNWYFFHQIRDLRRRGAEVQAAAMEMSKAVGDYETNSVPPMERFTLDLRRFAERNPDFAPILAKYPLPSGSPKTTNAPAASRPAAAPPKAPAAGKK